MSQTAMSRPSSAPLRKSLRATVGAVLACATGFVALSAEALPVIPQGAGYGMDTPAGRGGQVYKVTNLNATGAGSIRECVDAKGPRVCVFEVSGTIRLSGDLVVANPNITIAGQTAPSPGIMLRGGGLLIKTSDVLVQHLRVRPGDDPTGTNPENRDALKIESAQAGVTIKNVVVDHCSFSWAIDETFSAWAGWDNITVSNSIFAEPLHTSIHPKGAHGYGVILGAEGRAALIGNLLAHNVDRNPLSSTRELLFANNVIYNGGNGVKLSTIGSYVTKNAILGNVFKKGPNSGGQALVQIRAEGSDALASGSKVYLADNGTPSPIADPWSIATYYNCGAGNCTGDVTKYKTDTPPAWPAALTRLPASEEVVYNHVLKNVGARPADRDSVDQRIIEQVRTGTGQTINCVSADGSSRCQKNAGGWPNLPTNSRALTLPNNPNELTPSGYTHLELWLHKMSAEVEGRGAAPVPPQLVSGN